MNSFCLYVLMIALLGPRLCEGWAHMFPFRAVRRGAAAAALIAALSSSAPGAHAYEAFNEDFGDVSTSRGSVSLNPFASQKDLEEARARVRTAATANPPAQESSTSSTSEIDEVLRLIPSVKYFKIIADQYSQRSADYDGSTNLFMPLM